MEIHIIDAEFHNLYSSPSIMRVIKSRKMRWAGDAARMEKRNVYRIFVGKPKEGAHWEDQDVDVWTILKGI
jgi:hypothetical protein